MFAWVLACYQEINKLTDAAVCAQLACDVDTLNQLRLCGRPNPDPAEFAIDVQRVAERVGLDAGRLAEIVREVDAHTAFTGANRGMVAPPFLSTPGMLKAARDREEETGPQETGEEQQKTDHEDHEG
jgi:hypothetical protein